MALRDEVLADTPGIYLELDELSGSLISPDSSGNTRHADRIGGGPDGLIPAHSVVGRAARGRGRSTEYGIHIPDWYQLLDNWTFMMWVAPNENITVKTQATTGNTGTAGDQRFAAISPGESWPAACVSVGRNAIQVFEHGVGELPCLLSYAPGTPFALMRFICVHVVCTAKLYKLYVEGVLVKTGLTSVRAATAAPRRLLSDFWAGGFTGGLDEAAWWPYVLSDARIAAQSAAVSTPRPKAQLEANRLYHSGLVPAVRPKLRTQDWWTFDRAPHPRDFAPSSRPRHQVAAQSLGPLPLDPSVPDTGPTIPPPTWWPNTPSKTRHPVAP